MKQQNLFLHHHESATSSCSFIIMNQQHHSCSFIIMNQQHHSCSCIIMNQQHHSWFSSIIMNQQHRSWFSSIVMNQQHHSLCLQTRHLLRLCRQDSCCVCKQDICCVCRHNRCLVCREAADILSADTSPWASQVQGLAKSTGSAGPGWPGLAGMLIWRNSDQNHCVFTVNVQMSSKRCVSERGWCPNHVFYQ